MFKLCYLNGETVGEEPPPKVWRGCLTQYIIDPFSFCFKMFHVKHNENIMEFLKSLKLLYDIKIGCKLKLLFSKRQCKHCCLWCKYYKQCLYDLTRGKGI